MRLITTPPVKFSYDCTTSTSDGCTPAMAYSRGATVRKPAVA